MKTAINQISLNPTTVARILGIMALVLVLANIAGQFSAFVLGYNSLKGLIPLFDLDGEGNIPSFFSEILLLFAALLLAFIAVLNYKQNAPHTSKWAILSFGFLFMAFDEAFQLHETLTPLTETLLNSDYLGGIFYFALVIPAIAFIIIIGLFFLQFLLHLPAITRYRFLLAATIYLGGAIGFELLEGSYSEFLSTQDLTFNIMVTIEEALEMTGVIVFIWALLNYCADNYTQVQLQFNAK